MPPPKIAADASLARYLREIGKLPLLEAGEEYMLAKRWREHGDAAAAQKLVSSHLRLVAKVAMGYRGYGLPLTELIAEGNVGMMQALRRFDPDRGFRLSTYAIWWVRAAIQEYILRSWSLVRMGTTAAQKKLFFGLRRTKSRLGVVDEGDLPGEIVKAVGRELAVAEADVVEMNRRLGGRDQSLNTRPQEDGETEWQDWLADEAASPEERVGAAQELRVRRNLLERAMATLSSRERDIVDGRRLSDPPKSLRELAGRHGVSPERVRQLEERALEKLRQAIAAEIEARHIVLA